MSNHCDHEANPGQAGLALLAVLFALTLLMLLALPFAVSMSVGADAAMRDVEQTSTEQASASVRDLLLADVALSHPAIDPTPLYDGLDEWPQGVELPPAFDALAAGGRVLLGGEVIDLQRFLGLDSASPLLLANVLRTAGRLQEVLEPDATSCTVGGATGLPASGYVWVAGEVMSYEQREGDLLTGLQRGLFREQGFGDGSEPIAAEALVLDYRCVLAAIWPFFGRDADRDNAGSSGSTGPRSAVRQPYRSVGELLEIQAAGLGTFTTAEIDALDRAFAVDTQAEDSATWGRPERVFNDLLAGTTRTLTVKSAVHVGAGSTVRLRDLSTGASEYGLVMSTSTQRATQELLLPSVFQLDLLLPVSQAFGGGDTVVEPLVPAPVNLNTAPAEVLTAVFANVRRSADLRVNHADGRRNSAPPSISPQLADELAAQIVAARDPATGGDAVFTGWQDLVTRVFEPRLAAEGGNTGRNKWVVLYRNLQSGRDSILEMGTAPVCFKSGPWVRYRAAASRSRSLVAAGVVGRHERTGLAAALPGFRVEQAWTTQRQFEQAFLLDRRAPYWITSPINLGHLQPGDLGNDPSARYFAHLVPVAFPGLGLGAPRYAVDDEADSGIEPGVSTTPANIWARANNAPRAFDSFAQASHRRGRDVQRDGPYAMNNIGPSSAGAAGGGNTGRQVLAQQGGPGRHDQLSFPFSEQAGFMGRFGIGFWLEPQTLENRIVLDHSDGNPDRNRLSVLGRDRNLVFEVIDEAGIDPNPGDSPAGVVRTSSRVELPLAELGLPADTAVHLNVSATSGRPADLSFAVDGLTRGKPRFVTYLTAALPVFDPQLSSNRAVPGQRGNDRYVDLQVESTEGFPPTGILRVGLELFEYSSISGNSFQCQWRDSIGGRAARQLGREHRPAIPIDQNGEPTVGFDDPQFQGLSLDVFPAHPAGAMVELYGYAALVSEDTGMMVGSTNLSGSVGGFAVARGFVQSPRPIVMAPLQGQTIQIGVGLDATWSGDLELADPVPTGRDQPPNAAQPQIADAFALDGGYALLVQRRRTFTPNLAGQVGGTPAEVGGVELIRYGARQGTRLTGVLRAQTIPGQDNLIARDLYDGTARQFVTDWEDWPLGSNPQATSDDVPTLILWVVPISLSVQNVGALWDPQQTQLTEWLQLRPQGSAPEDTEWVRYDAILDNRFVVRGNRGAWRNLAFQLTQTLAGERIDWGLLGPNQTADVTTPPWGTVQATAGFIGYTPQIESLFPQILRARQALRFRGDPFTETSSHPQNNSQVTACQRLQLLWGNYGAYTGRVGRHDRVALVQGSIASGTSRPAVEWHTVHWQARRYNSDNLQQNQQPEELLGPWPFQLVAFKDGVRGLYLGPPRGTLVTDPRQFDRLVKFPSGELPAAFCQNPTVGAGANGELPMQGLVDEVEVVAHIAQDLVLDEPFTATAQTFTVNRNFTNNSAGALWSQTDLSAQFPQTGGLVQVDSEILGYQSVADGVFQVAQNGRGLLNTEPREHDRGARVMFLTHRPAAILAGGVGAQESSLPLQAMGPLPIAGTLLLGRELLHYCWARQQVNTLEMPRWYPPAPPGERIESSGRGLFRGRYGTVPQGASSGEVVISWPFRYWDRYAEFSDDPELAYFQLTTNEAPVFFRDVRWREETRDPRVELICRVRTDSQASWTDDPATTPGLWEFRGGQSQSQRHQLGRQASRLEVRFMTAYRPGAIDLQSFTAHGWKTSSRVEDVRVEYEGQGRIFDERVTAR